MRKQTVLVATLFFFIGVHNLFSQITEGKDSSYQFLSDISYKDGHTEYENDRCKLDLYLPKDEKPR